MMVIMKMIFIDVDKRIFYERYLPASSHMVEIKKFIGNEDLKTEDSILGSILYTVQDSLTCRKRFSLKGKTYRGNGVLVGESITMDSVHMTIIFHVLHNDFSYL